MLAFLRGEVRMIGTNYVILENGGVGYRVTLPLATLLQQKSGQSVELYIHEHQRDDGRELYGFTSFEDLELADLLLTVSGVGPKIAQVLVDLGVGKVRQAICAGDVNAFLSVSGIGKKRAQQIILELKGTIDVQNLDGASSDEVVMALQQLGYGTKEISEALRKVTVAGTTEERLREALSMLAK